MTMKTALKNKCFWPRLRGCMKKLVPLFCFCASVAAASGQGLINFFNNATTLVSVGNVCGLNCTINGSPGSFYFALLTSPAGANGFTFAGVYATNQVVAGRFNGGAGVAVPGWAPGTARDFEVAGWSASMGHDFNPAWLTGNFGAGPFGFFGVSGIGTGVAGGTTSSASLPPLNIFGGASGIQNGFSLYSPLIPEPSSLSLSALGAAVFLILRRKRPTLPLQRNRRRGGNLVL